MSQRHVLGDHVPGPGEPDEPGDRLGCHPYLAVEQGIQLPLAERHVLGQITHRPGATGTGQPPPRSNHLRAHLFGPAALPLGQ